VDLRPAGDAGLDGEPPALAPGVARDLHGDRGPRADDRHLAAQHVDEVRQLVEARPAQQAPDTRDARVALRDRQAAADVLGAGDHRPQLEDVEGLAVAADAALAVDRRPRGLQADRQDRHQQQRRGEHERERRDDDVEQPPSHQRVPSGGAQPTGVPWRRWSNSPAATLACVAT
jgi:hypothetical protein